MSGGRPRVSWVHAQRVLNNRLGERGISAKVVTLITQVLVDGQDPAFKIPANQLGPLYREEFENMSEGEKANYVEDSGRVIGGWSHHKTAQGCWYQTIEVGRRR